MPAIQIYIFYIIFRSRDWKHNALIVFPRNVSTEESHCWTGGWMHSQQCQRLHEWMLFFTREHEITAFLYYYFFEFYPRGWVHGVGFPSDWLSVDFIGRYHPFKQWTEASRANLVLSNAFVYKVGAGAIVPEVCGTLAIVLRPGFMGTHRTISIAIEETLDLLSSVTFIVDDDCYWTTANSFPLHPTHNHPLANTKAFLLMSFDN